MRKQSPRNNLSKVTQLLSHRAGTRTQILVSLNLSLLDVLVVGFEESLHFRPHQWTAHNYSQPDPGCQYGPIIYKSWTLNLPIPVVEQPTWVNCELWQCWPDSSISLVFLLIPCHLSIQARGSALCFCTISALPAPLEIGPVPTIICSPTEKRSLGAEHTPLLGAACWFSSGPRGSSLELSSAWASSTHCVRHTFGGLVLLAWQPLTWKFLQLLFEKASPGVEKAPTSSPPPASVLTGSWLHLPSSSPSWEPSSALQR